MSQPKKRRCQFCWAMRPTTELTTVTTNKNERKRWEELLGPQFKNEMDKKGEKRGYICRSHFPEDVVLKRRSKDSRPMKNEDMKTAASSSRIDANVSAGNLDDIDDFTMISADESMRVDSVAMENPENVSEIGDASLDGFSIFGSDDEEDSEDCGEWSSFHPDTDETEESSDSDEEEGTIDYALVQLDSLIEGMKWCRKCGTDSVDFSVEKPVGYAVSIEFDCLKCANTWKWFSSPKIPSTREYVVNRDVVSASICTGSSFTKVSSLFRTLRVPFLKSTKYYEIVRKHVRPVVQKLHDETQAEVQEIVIQNALISGRGIDLAGDAQFDSPGHTAEYARYALLDVETNLVVQTQLLRKSSKSESSKSLEPKSLDLALSKFENSLLAADGSKKVEIASITTDRDPSVGKLLSLKYPHITQYFDGWHYARNTKKAIWIKQHQVQMRPVSGWIKKLNNHLYHSFATSSGDGQLTVEKFLSFFLHIQNIHENFDEINGIKFTKFKKCEHDTDISDEDWIDLTIPAHAKAFTILWNLTANTKRLKDLTRISPFFSTSEVESYNALATIYHPKSSFFHANFPLRVQLTFLHWNHQKLEWFRGDRNIVGRKSYYNKSTKQYVWKYKKSAALHKWRRVVLLGVRCHSCTNDNTGSEQGQSNGDREEHYEQDSEQDSELTDEMA